MSLNNLSSLPISELGQEILASEDKVLTAETFAEKHELSKSSWFLPQALAVFANAAAKKKNQGGETSLYCARETLRSLGSGKAGFMVGLLSLLNLTRSNLVSGRICENARYNSFVPLVLSAYKEYDHIPYSSWDKEFLHLIVDPKLLEAMLMPEVPDGLTPEYILEHRPKWLTRAGKVQNSRSAYGLNHYKNTLMEKVPMFARMMLAQTWCAHPSNRSTYQILDPINWDNVPEVLIPTSLVPEWDKEPATLPRTHHGKSNQVPWA